MYKEKIIFMGTPEMSKEYLISLYKNNLNIIAAYTQSPKRKERGMEIKKTPVHSFCEKNNILVYSPKNFNLSDNIEEFKALKPDICIVMGYGILFPKEVLNIPKFGFINIHVSLLPRWRGPSPIEYAILNGDTKTGVTIFQIEEKLDTGPILSFREINIHQNDSKEYLSNQLNELGTKLLLETLPKIFNKKVSYKAQNELQATYTKKITSKTRQINFNDDVKNVYNLIRAFSPKPAAWFICNKDRISILECDMDFCKSEASSIMNSKFHIGCKNGIIIPKIIQREGRKPMNIEDFLRGYKFKINQEVNVKN